MPSLNALPAGLLLALAAGPLALAQNVHVGAPTSAISQAVAVPAGSDMLYVSGMTPPALNAGAPKGTPPVFGDTKTQVTGVLKRLEEALKGQGYGFGDVVMMRVYLVGDPAKGGAMDFAGMMEAYTQAFGTPAQPNKPARVTMQVAALVQPGMLAEIEVQAAKAKK
ncbi:MAG: RidA family protein [Phenylobacterium sp.]|uniref:RidA family protein n=1 Tax=Phenylobacterium sp. TaxID=1871053 RepID=UPI002736CAA3|nr:RidA family protein [Phenylobacterium sp.]MDP3173595.1 RidA family protein [Phenylobacterium sp.]